MKKKLPDIVYNPITISGSAIAVVSFGLIIFLILLESLAPNPKPYMGIVAFVLLPAFLIIGIFISAFGIYREYKKLSQGHKRFQKFPKIDLNDPKNRIALALVFLASVLLLMFTAFGSYKAYEYTESDEFCGTICHKVMNPEFTAYKSSPHARVGCVQCHIGSGADWFVKAKISGSYQVYSVLFNKYSKPIQTPIEHLRPAQQTCENCHWPKHFFSEKRVKYSNFLSDENNTRFDLDLILKVGGGNIETGPTSGIHWHMNINNQILYIAIDKKRLIIPYVKTIDKDGKEIEYRSTDTTLTNNELKNFQLRTLDCIDCHNRPSHNFHPPAPSMNNLLALNIIDKSLPYIKSIAIKSLEANYSNTNTGFDSIKIKILEFYETNYPEIFISKKDKIEQAIKEVQKIYSRNYFPEMGISWSKYPEHIGHMFSPGCFRCHDGKHKSDDGKIISKDCNGCHLIINQKFENQKPSVDVNGLKYTHPVDIGKSWEISVCSDCHNKK